MPKLIHRLIPALAIAAGLLRPALAATPPGPLLTTAYFGELITHPGLLIGYEVPLWQHAGQRVFATASAGGYLHARSHTLAFLTGDVGYRLALPLGLSVECSGGGGYRHTWLAGDLLTAVPGGPPVSGADAGRPGLLAITTLGLGYDLASLKIGADKAFVKASTLWEYPVNTLAIMHAALQAGLQWRL